MKHYLRIFFGCVLLICLFNISCNKFSIDISHRKYRQGFYVDISRAKSVNSEKKNQTKTEIVKAKKTESVQRQNLPCIFTDTTTNTFANHGFENKMHPEHSTAVSKGTRKKPENVVSKKEQETEIFPLKENNRNKNTHAFYLLGAVAGLLSSALFISIRKRAVKISQWSSRNLALSRTIQVIGHTIIGFGSFIAGSILFNHDMVATPLASGIFTSVFLASVAVYPANIRGKAVLQSLYNRTKLNELAVVISGALMLASIGNQVAQERFTVSTGQVIRFTPAHNIFTNISSKADIIDEALFQVATTEGERLSAGQIILFILIPIVFGFLTLLLLALSCAINCQGNGGLAALVLVCGLGLLIFLAIASVNGVKKMKGKRKPAIIDQK